MRGRRRARRSGMARLAVSLPDWLVVAATMVAVLVALLALALPGAAPGWGR